ncbi:MAG: tetratricopeptide repeat protein [Ignavibacteria bacterium]|nr:tetratricopeptide repeat protein [Ignavibacteria bacterium]
MKTKIVIFFVFVFSASCFSSDFDFKFRKAIELFDSKNYEESYLLFSQLKDYQTLNVEKIPLVYFYLGENKFRLEQFFESSLEFEYYVWKYPFDRNYDLGLLRLGQIFFKLGEYPKARQYLTKLLEESPEHEFYGLAEYWIAECYFQEGDLISSEHFYLESIKNRATNKHVDHSFFALAYLYETRGEFEKSELYFDRLLFELPESRLTPLALVRVANSYYQLGKYQRAISKLNDPQVKSLPQTNLAEASYILANCYYRANQFADASREFESTIQRYPNSNMTRPAIYGLAWSLYQENKLQAAHHTLKKLTDGIDSLAERATYWLGFFSRNMNENDQAIEEFKEYLRKYPIFRLADKAKFEIGMIYYLQKRFKDAETYLFSVSEVTRDMSVRAKASLVLGNMALDRRNFPNAKMYFESAVSSLDESSADFNVASTGLGISNFYLNNFETAGHIFRNLLTRKNLTEVDKVRLYLAESNFAMKNFSDAAVNYEAVLRQSKSKDLIPVAHYGLVYSNFNLKNYSYVVNLGVDFLKKYPASKHSPEIKLRLADSYYATKEYSKASEAYRDYFNSSTLGRGSDYATYQYAQALYKAGNINGAIDEFVSFQNRFPASKYADEAQYVIGWIRFQQGLYDNSIFEYEKVLEKYPTSALIPIVYYSVGDAYFNKGLYDLAISSYQRVLDNYMSSDIVIDAMNGIQYSYVAQGKVDEAASAISNFVSLNPSLRNLDRLLIKKGDLFLSQRRYQDAISSYREFISIFPSSGLVPSAYYSIAKAFIQSKSYTDAIQNLTLIFRNFSSSELADDAVLECGNVYRSVEDYDKAIQMYDYLISNFSKSALVPEAVYWKGVSFVDRKQFDLAVTHFQHIITNYSSNAYYSRTLYELGKISMNQGNIEQARNYFKQVVDLRNDEFGAESQYYIGEFLYSQKLYDEAITEFLRLKFAFAGHVEWLAKGLFKVSESYEILKDKSKAKDFYREVQKLQPTSEIGIEAKKRADKIR